MRALIAAPILGLSLLAGCAQPEYLLSERTDAAPAATTPPRPPSASERLVIVRLAVIAASGQYFSKCPCCSNASSAEEYASHSDRRTAR